MRAAFLADGRWKPADLTPLSSHSVADVLSGLRRRGIVGTMSAARKHLVSNLVVGSLGAATLVTSCAMMVMDDTRAMGYVDMSLLAATLAGMLLFRRAGWVVDRSFSWRRLLALIGPVVAFFTAAGLGVSRAHLGLALAALAVAVTASWGAVVALDVRALARETRG